MYERPLTTTPCSRLSRLPTTSPLAKAIDASTSGGNIVSETYGMFTEDEYRQRVSVSCADGVGPTRGDTPVNLNEQG